MHIVRSIEPQGDAPRSRRDNRGAILAAARKLSAQHGLAGITFDDIARETRLTRRTIYNHFANVGDLFTASMRVAIERLARELPQPPAAGDDPIAALERHLGELLAFFCSAGFREANLALVLHGGVHPSLRRNWHGNVIAPLQRSLANWLGQHGVGGAQGIATDLVALALGLAESARMLDRPDDAYARHLRPLIAALAISLSHPPSITLDRVA